jgi:predicted regulator of Ras-like GTPase activity (Roadblock/LC7/MglB family)
MSLILGEEELDKIQNILGEHLINIGVKNAMLIDMAGNIVSICNSNSDSGMPDAYSLAALAAANFGAMCSIARIIGEEDFSMLFHKGQKDNISFTKIDEDYLLITVFTTDLSLGLLRLKMDAVIEELHNLLTNN